jgi:hypothetical protein
MTDVPLLCLIIILLSAFSALIVLGLIQIVHVLEDLRADLSKLETGRHE